MPSTDSPFEQEVFADLYRHLIIDGYNQLQRLRTRLVPEATLQDLAETAFVPLARKAWERLFMVEMNFADQEGLLQGRTEAERFEFFVDEVMKPENFALLLRKYPGLEEQWQRDISTYTTALVQLIERIEQDIGRVAREFYGDESIGEVRKISLVGDPHRGMQQSARIDYADGEGKARTVYYKARNLAIDEGFFNFIAWWNQHAPIEHRAPRVLNRGEYGWAEAIPRKECENQDQVRAFYRRYGSILAFAQIFAARDLHMENIIASGEYPVIVDLETLFSCTLAYEQHSPAIHHLYSSLLLPARFSEDEMEVSPLGAQANTMTTIEVLANPQRRSSALKMESRKWVTGDYGSKVFLVGETVDFVQYEDCLVEGLRDTLNYFNENRASLQEILTRVMSGAWVRIVRRATAEYIKVLNNVYHPESLAYQEARRDIRALTCDMKDGDILASELEELERGDVPYFQMPFDEAVLFDGRGRALATPVFHSPRQNVEYELSRLTGAFIDQVTEDIRFSFLIYRANKRQGAVALGPAYDNLAGVPDDRWLGELGRIVLGHLMDRAMVLEDYRYWRNVDMVDESTVRMGLSGIDLYDGTAGLALAFHAVGRWLSCERFLDFARVLTNQTIRALEKVKNATPGAYSGTIGVLWAASVAQSDRLPQLLPPLDRELANLSRHLITNEWIDYKDLDIIGGVAGMLQMLLRLHRIYRDFPVADVIEKLSGFAFELLKEKSPVLLNDETLLGFAHGTAGVSAVLAEYMTYFGQHDPEAVATIMRHIAHETRYRTDAGWRRLDKGGGCNTSWCHGTVGIGFSRLQCRPYIPDDVYEADMGIVTARLGERQPSLCLCHGMIADYWLARALGLDCAGILHRIRRETELHGISTDMGLNGFELVGAMSGVSSLFVGETLFLTGEGSLRAVCN
ncbi:type 2 lanthipeptide synthetase LanM family protein [Phyllobacterium leguminum]|uniref:Type 2 lantibiotic biosynthesis protein LanM n=1 Tax=Phyllobacterium leguminum TaxID=314237 RepID=A0A318SYS9_9HYPH|nr:type 2 lanthipeptide synthetase LanM family protein [Phyllobacterium leguminum]PYE86489.1 type 2 lantibiotic biosynthesis protein LanM [Phyllobacterium leguminum]